jgi:hypothetical protein
MGARRQRGQGASGGRRQRGKTREVRRRANAGFHCERRKRNPVEGRDDVQCRIGRFAPPHHKILVLAFIILNKCTKATRSRTLEASVVRSYVNCSTRSSDQFIGNWLTFYDVNVASGRRKFG